MLQKTLKLEIKAADAATGIVKAYVAGFGNIDRVGDIIMPGAFLKTIPQFVAEGVILWNHNTDMPIGKPISAGEDAKGLWVEFQMALKIAKAQEVFDLMKDGYIKKFSIGYDVKNRIWLTEDNMTIYAPADATPGEISAALKWGAALIEIELYEISPVSVPANTNTGVESIKSLKDSELEALKTAQTEAEAAPVAANTTNAIKLRQIRRRVEMRALSA